MELIPSNGRQDRGRTAFAVFTKGKNELRRLKLPGELLQNKIKLFSSYYFFRRGVFNYLKGKHDKAAGYFLRAIDTGAWNDTVVSACIYCAISYYREREYDKTVKYLHKYLEHEPDGRYAVDVRRIILNLEI